MADESPLQPLPVEPARQAADVMPLWLCAWRRRCSASAIGSFLNVCIYRLPRGESIVWPALALPDCGKPTRLV